MAVTEADQWAGATLAALRKKAGLTQDKLAELARIERSAYNALENGRRRITPTYAERIAPHIDLEDPTELLPRPAEVSPGSGVSPLDRLAELEGEVARLRAERDFVLREVVARLAAVEAAQGQLGQQQDQQSNTTD